MLLTGLQNLSSPFPNNYPILQPFSGVSTKPMFTETSLNQSCPIISHQNNKNIIYPHTSHETQTRPKTHQTEKSISKSTTIPPPNFVRSKTIQPLIQNSSTLFHTSNISQNETLSYPMRKNEDIDFKKEEDIEYENVEYLDDAN